MQKILPIGIYDFKQMITENYYYIDKTLLIKELLDKKAAATLIPRPRRFGKTLNMSMLQYFFEKTEVSHAYLFDGLAVAQHADIMAYQGQYPVIFLTFKFIDELSWDNCYSKLKLLIADEFRRHEYLLQSNILDKKQKQDYENIISGAADRIIYETSLKNLIRYLAEYHAKRTIVLIDEYDVPMHAGYHHGYLTEVSHFIKSFFGDGLKDNNKLELAVITGALRVARESIFTGWNNVKVCTFLSESYTDKFGLLEHEVQKIIYDYNLENKINDIRFWYNNYKSGSFTLYNPWSIINLVDNRGRLQPYWINTSSNDIVKKLIKNSDTTVKKDIEILIEGGTITKPLCQNIVYTDIEINSNALWNFLFFSGYLTYKNNRLIDNMPYIDFLIPNNEVLYLYKSIILSWFEEQPRAALYQNTLTSLIQGNIDVFKEIFQEIVITSLSYFDVSGEKPENFYHAFVLGLLVSLSNKYYVKSNRESGYGRYDVMIIPHDKHKLGIIIEFKKVSTYTQETLEQAAQNALDQIERMQYEQEMKAHGITNMIKLGIACAGKKVLIEHRKSDA